MGLPAASAALTLRPYQEQLARQVTAALAPGAPVMCQLPTGAGKTAVAAHLLKVCRDRQPGAALLWVTHRDLLADQAAAALVAAGLPVVDWRRNRDDRGRWQPGAVHVVSDRWRALPAEPPAPGLAVYDEAHHAITGRQGTRWVTWWGGPVLGLTATPWRLSRQEGLRPPWQQLVTGPPVAQLQDDGWLARCVVRSAPGGVSVQRELLRRRAQDFTVESSQQEVRRLLEQTTALKHARAELTEFGARRTLWFVPGVDAARSLHRMMGEQQMAASVLLGDTGSDERSAVVRRFSDGSTPHLVSVDVLLEGLDVPACDSMVVLRPTTSLTVHLQMFGRSMRPAVPGVNGGTVLVVDLAGNTQQPTLGLPEAPHRWSLAARGAAGGDGEAPTVTCRDCRTVNAIAARSCGGCEVPFGRVCADDEHQPSGCRRWRRHSQFKSGNSRVCRECADAYEGVLRGVRAARQQLRFQPKPVGYHATRRMAGVERTAAHSTARWLRLSNSQVTADLLDAAWENLATWEPKWDTSRNGNPTCLRHQLRVTLVGGQHPRQQTLLAYPAGAGGRSSGATWVPQQKVFTILNTQHHGQPERATVAGYVGWLAAHAARLRNQHPNLAADVLVTTVSQQRKTG